MASNESLKDNWRRGKEVLGAYFRQGLHELGSVFYGPGTAAQHAEYGMIGTRTPGQVAEGLRGERDPESSRSESGPSLVDQHVEHAKERSAMTPQQEQQRPDLERE